MITQSHILTYEGLKLRVPEEREHAAFASLNLVTSFKKIISGFIHWPEDFLIMISFAVA